LQKMLGLLKLLVGPRVWHVGDVVQMARCGHYVVYHPGEAQHVERPCAIVVLPLDGLLVHKLLHPPLELNVINL